jgi:hypothetical protein
MHRVIYRPSTKLLSGAGKGTTLNRGPSVSSQTKAQNPLPWDAIALFLNDSLKVDLRGYPHLMNVLERLKDVPIYCFEAVPATLQALLSVRFESYGAGSAFMSVGTHEAIILDFGLLRQCSQRLGCGVEATAIAAFLHEYGHYLAHRAEQSNTEATAWGWARRLNKLHGFVSSQLLTDFEQLIGA